MTWNDLHIWPKPDAQNDKLHVGAQFIAPSCHITYELGAIHCAPSHRPPNQHDKRERNHHAL
jgi:hypothetical protein